MNRNAIAVGLSTGLVLFIASVWRAERRLARQNNGERHSKVAPTQLHTWEGEGGNVPDVQTPLAATPSDLPGPNVLTH